LSAEIFEHEVGGPPHLEVGKVAGLANGAVTMRYGDTVILVTACMSAEPREGIDFFPLTVDFEERLYAAGKIPGGWFRREGRPSTTGILTARLTDRPLRPLFPKGMRNDVQITVTTLSADQRTTRISSIIGASTALTISDIPFGGQSPARGWHILRTRSSSIPRSRSEGQLTRDRRRRHQDAVASWWRPEPTRSPGRDPGGDPAAQEVNRQIIELRRRWPKVGKEFVFEPATVPDEVTAAVVDFATSRDWDSRRRQDERAELMQSASELLRAQRASPAEFLKAALDGHLRTRSPALVEDGVRPDGRNRMRSAP
jgi:hypothetical protein